MPRLIFSMKYVYIIFGSLGSATVNARTGGDLPETRIIQLTTSSFQHCLFFKCLMFITEKLNSKFLHFFISNKKKLKSFTICLMPSTNLLVACLT
jgi:hypothetical protein